MKKFLLLFTVCVLHISAFAGSKAGIDFKIGTGYMDTVKTEYINSAYETNSLSTIVIGAGVEYYDNSSVYVGGDIELAVVDDAYTNAYGSLTTIFGKVGLHLDRSVIVYGLGGFAYQSLKSDTISTNGTGYVVGGGIKLNHKENIGMEVNLKRSQLSDEEDETYYVNSITVNGIFFF
ncbi:MAG: hypothetical protein U9O56_07505 [Campylobacterota bacterium]|nr:hypothetical protein [Campylobacterota bacterium]